MEHAAAVVAFVALLAPTLAAADGFEPAPPAPNPIVNGVDADVCDWPAAVAMRDEGGDVFCSGALVHPQVVLTAAHCLGREFEVGFGNDGLDPERTAGIMWCQGHPSYNGQVGTEGFDVAYCVLEQPVFDVPIVPVLSGCEVDQRQAGVEVMIVGFGSTQANWNPDVGWEFVEGIGPKRYTVQTLERVSELDQGLYLVSDEDSSACPGDSGGPALLQLDDGSWRVLGAGSRIHPDAPLGGNNDCGYGAIYSSYAHVLPWLEEQTTLDLTPCTDADGTWSPDERCTEFPLTPGDGTQSSGSWADGCGTDMLSEPGQSCGDPFEFEPVGSSSSGGMSSSSTTDASSSSTGGAEGDASTGALSGVALSDSSTADAAAEDSDGGCSCRTAGSAAGGGLAWAVFGLLVLGVRRRPPHTAA